MNDGQKPEFTAILLIVFCIIYVLRVYLQMHWSLYSGNVFGLFSDIICFVIYS